MGAKGIALLAGLTLLCGAPVVAAAEAPLSGDTVFLPNLDDDQRRCHVDPADLDRPGPEVDVRLAACNDAADDQVNGSRDEEDLARLRAGRLRGAAGQVTVDGQARVFVKRNGGFSPDTRLSGAELRRGVELGVEGRDIVRDPARWDGWVTVKLTIDGKLGASHRMRVAPLLFQNDLQPATTVFAARPARGPGWPDAVPLPSGFPEGWDEFSAPLRQEASTKFIAGTAQWWKDVWWQDLFEPASASMPTRHGTQTMRVAIRSANVFDMGSGPTPRPAGRLLFRDFRGPDVAVVQEYTVESRSLGKDLINATGNIETVPPYPGFPQGRLVYGSGASRQPDPAFIKMLTAQGQQPPIVLDTTWLAVGHVDEPLHVVRANNARGWTLLVADPRLAVDLLKKVPRQRNSWSTRPRSTSRPRRSCSPTGSS
ncbi:protein-arginine deiminase family protein [Amycolatopsis sp. cg5]|uniref:protein-arginine deiminase family protein n=1 Tax=Amycolatopsis sp. cg5 TaxID=3238802 RepID=UPI003524A78D